MGRSTTYYNNSFVLIICSVSLLLMQCSNKESSSTEYPISKVSLQGKGFLQDWNNRTLEALAPVEKRYCSTKINSEANSCGCIDNRKHRISLQNDTSYNFLDSRHGLLLAYNRAIKDDKQLKPRAIYIIEIDKSGEIRAHHKIVFVLSSFKSTYYEFENYEDLAGGWQVKKSAIIPDKARFLLDSLWISVEKPLQNKPEDYCGDTFISLTKVDENITTRVPAYTHKNWFKILSRINAIIK